MLTLSGDLCNSFNILFHQTVLSIKGRLMLSNNQFQKLLQLRLNTEMLFTQNWSFYLYFGLFDEYPVDQRRVS